MNAPYRYLLTALSADAAPLIDDLCAWHDRMVAHLRRHGHGHRCACDAPDECPRLEARDLWTRAESHLGAEVGRLTFLRAQAEGARHA